MSTEVKVISIVPRIELNRKIQDTLKILDEIDSRWNKAKVDYNLLFVDPWKKED